MTDEYLLSIGLTKSLSELNLYVKYLNYDILIVSLYVDDLFVAGRNIVFVEELKQNMFNVFEMTDCGEMSLFLGMEVKKMKRESSLIRRNMQMRLCRSFKWRIVNIWVLQCF